MNTTREIRESVTYVQMCMGPYLLVHGTQVPSRLVERTTIGKNDACGVTEVLANTVTRGLTRPVLVAWGTRSMFIDNEGINFNITN